MSEKNVQSSTSSQGFKTVDVRENVQKDSGEMKEKHKNQYR
jgi:hypothetical protein